MNTVQEQTPALFKWFLWFHTQSGLHVNLFNLNFQTSLSPRPSNQFPSRRICFPNRRHFSGQFTTFQVWSWMAWIVLDVHMFERKVPPTKSGVWTFRVSFFVNVRCLLLVNRTIVHPSPYGRSRGPSLHISEEARSFLDGSGAGTSRDFNGNDIGLSIQMFSPQRERLNTKYQNKSSYQIPNLDTLPSRQLLTRRHHDSSSTALWKWWVKHLPSQQCVLRTLPHTGSNPSKQWKFQTQPVTWCDWSWSP